MERCTYIHTYIEEEKDRDKETETKRDTERDYMYFFSFKMPAHVLCLFSLRCLSVS